MGSSFDRFRRRLDAGPLAPLAAVGVAAGSAAGAALLWAPSGARVVVAAGLAGLAVPLAWSARMAVEGVAKGTVPAVRVHPPALLEMVEIQGGSFLMGSDNSDPRAQEDELPQHQVKVGSFLLGKYVVSQAEYEEVTGGSPSTHKGARKPVTNVSWKDAVKFCNLLSKREGYELAYDLDGDKVSWKVDADGYRLPTEAEWEYAARAGSQTAWSFGDDESSIGEYAWFGGNAGTQPHPVGEKLPNPRGLFDMHGNVWEWCWDSYGSYSEVSRSEGGRVVRGGSFVRFAGDLRSASRYGHLPIAEYWDLGIRCARGANQPSRYWIVDR